MRAGRSAPDALKGLLSADDGRDVRQVAMIDTEGRVAAHTGARCIPAAGNVVGKGFSVQANLMESATVWPAMAKAFEAAKGDLAVEKKDDAGALKAYAAAEALVPDNAEMVFWHAAALVNMGRVDEALPLFAKAYGLHPKWRDLVPRLPKAGLLPDDPKLIARIVAAR